jgi:hypothetical protein
MNKRIQELANQCTEWVTGTIDGDYEYFDSAKFAQLIVQECAGIARNANLEDVEGGDSSVLYAASEQIKANFGLQ